ncbi:uncharacterized protein LDX57_007306 [Aspergillus melleus]|uniref:uncharacterized protein n=1 Tax=Aspergillus melleus TaxID=138277 RepID=UPI001E8DE697|nr:uncharacterized protein LDX57_007306 [Aspergillus melleus]KAH8429634.1 hypothetical protein LDX57_007306 [Aspergillus melleus]
MSPLLPNDIILLVGEFLEDHEDRYNLVFVCRRFHDLLLRLVYRKATLKNASQTRSFLNALLRRPELARAVRSLHFDDWKQTSSTSSISSSQHIYWTPFKNWARSISQSEEEYVQWEQDLLDDVEEAWIALALPLASNLRQLRLVYPQKSVYLDRTLQRALKGEKPFDDQSAFRVLQEVSLGHMENEADTPGSFAPSQLFPFFQLPSMRALSAYSVVESSSSSDDEAGQTTETPQVGFSRISEITLHSSNGSKGMEGLIASCPSLRSFKYQHSDSHLLSEGYRPSEFARSLAASKGSLETLWLDSFGTHLPFTIAGANETHDEWFGTLADFTALKDIRIRLPNLLDVRYQLEPSTALPDVLPPSVQTLSVEGCKEMSLRMLIGQLKLVLGQREKRFVGLRRLDIEGLFHDEEDEDASGYDADAANTGAEKVIKPRIYEMTEALHISCAEAGIELHLRDRDCPSTMT